ncbi:hypothetical protein KKF84_10590 [Myxococcota bacterium]|nr:hypothetical protein [Myxococcota bacterium]MBU1535759.1 hypothetical protein [Myxococcota bacterium]
MGLISLTGTNLPIAFRPGVSVQRIILDATRGRAILSGPDHLILIHYADPTAADHPEVLDLRHVLGASPPSGEGTILPTVMRVHSRRTPPRVSVCPGPHTAKTANSPANIPDGSTPQDKYPLLFQQGPC